ncbi:unnamed protein product [Cuscuta campestris]|uniref:CCHC-type domain-containing protein n=1 Tax=Cuscuta campestris TaxID=132261 RepID=A0A484MQ01_9ASTE|nr:unnamed protein product [Cuscuta campestris]
MLDSVDMWVQLHDLPFGYTSGAVLEQIGNFIGTFIKFDERQISGVWKAFYRIRVSISVAKPLKRRMKLIKRDNTWCWVNFKYERLHMFCFYCGLLGHSDKFCLAARESELNIDQYPYGSWLRAGVRRGPRAVGERWLVQDRGRPEELEESSQTVDVNAHGKAKVGEGPPAAMSTLSWNCRGLGNPRTVREIVDMVSTKKPNFVFLMETKVGREHAERVRVKLGFEGLFYVDRVGLSGGLAFFWRRNNTARLHSFSRNHIDIGVNLPGLPPWRLTCFYGYPERVRHVASWNLLRDLSSSSSLPWVVIGDFNDLLFQHEKRGPSPHPDCLLQGFGDALENCGLEQVPFVGYPYTWERGKGTDAWVEEKLDRAVANESWTCVFETTKVYNCLVRSSDHSALFLDIFDRESLTFSGQRRFRFEMAWLLDEGCRGVVEESWREGRGLGLMSCLHMCGNKLMKWGGSTCIITHGSKRTISTFS